MVKILVEAGASLTDATEVSYGCLAKMFAQRETSKAPIGRPNVSL